MATQLAVPSERDNLRISQLLPTVKCSDCADAVLLSELAEHVCQPKPSSALLSKRIEEEEASTARAVSPAVRQKRIEPESKSSRAATPSVPQKRPEAEVKNVKPAPSPSHHKRPSSNLRAYGRASPAPKIPLPATPTPNPRSTPDHISKRRTPSHDTSSIHSFSTHQSLPSPTSPSPISPGSTSSIPPPNRLGDIPTASTIKPQLSIHVPSNPIPQIPNHALQPPTPSQPSHSPSPVMYDFPEPETTVGGEAGMAGVGRRGFAAAARAAMFTTHTFGQHSLAQHHSSIRSISPSPTHPLNPFQPIRPTPHLLDISAATLNKPSDAPASDGDSNSPSPSPSPLPKSPSPQVPAAPVHARTASSFSSESGAITAPGQDPDMDIGLKSKRPIPPALNLSDIDRAEPPSVSSPAVSVAKLPFFEKFKTKLSTPTTTQFPSLPNPFDSTDEEPKQGSSLAKEVSISRASSVSSSYSFKSSAVGRESQVSRPRKMSSASSSSQMSAPFSFLPREDSSGGAPTREPASPIESDSDCGLAYADETDVEDADVSPAGEPATTGVRVRFPSTSSSQTRSRAGSNASSASGLGQSVAPLRIVRRPSDTNSSGLPFDRERANSTASEEVTTAPKSGIASAMMRTRSNSTSSTASKTSASSSYSRTTGVGLGMLAEKAQKEMEIVWEDRPLSQIRESSEEAVYLPRPMAQRANTVPALLSPDIRGAKLPTRSKTERDSVRARATSNDVIEQKGRKRRVKVCVRCDKRIEDGRWVNVDNEGKRQGNNVLCERCWKNLYLPKCRRCNLPIETQAVSSSDGQLKGKYHKECFNCHQCHKPFPDKSFYVFDGKPFCAYHYHEANDSLCAAALCGQPIEGPCAVSHTGDRYHPEHLTCEWPDEMGGCAERLVEYWEVGGRMLCEKHSQGHGAYDVNSNAENRSADRSQKRVTRFIDLAGAISGKQGVGEKF